MSWLEPSLAVGEHVADVEITEQLGIGGGVEVWRAQAEDGRMAVVMSLTKGAEDDARDNFLVEANTWTERWEDWHVPGVLKVLEVDPIASGYVGDLDARGTLADIAAEQLDDESKLGVFGAIVDIIAALHDKGLVHGWLRPENILLDQDGNPVIANARTLDVATSCRVSPEAVSEHQAYTAPEVRMGTAADASGDVYALGRLLHFVLTGETPDEKDERLPRLDALREQDPMLMRISRYCVLMDKEERYLHAGEVAADLTRFSEGARVGMPHPDFDGDEEPPSPRRSSDAIAIKGADLKYKSDKKEKTPSVRPSKPADEPKGWTTKLSLIFGGIGLLLLAVGLAGTVLIGEEKLALQVMVWASAFPLGMTLPGKGRVRALGRGLIGALILGIFVFVDPVNILKDVSTAGLKSKAVEERVAALKSLRGEGKMEFRSVDLTGADLSDMNMVQTAIDGSSLRGCNCKNIDLTDASSWNVDVTNADFSGAKLRGLDPHTVAGWETVKCDKNTTMPPGWLCRDGHPKTAKSEAQPKETDEKKE